MQPAALAVRPRITETVSRTLPKPQVRERRPLRIHWVLAATATVVRKSLPELAVREVQLEVKAPQATLWVCDLVQVANLSFPG